MTPIADMVEQMISQGVTADLIVLAIRTIERHGSSRDASRDSHADRRDKDRARQQKRRDKINEIKAVAKANDVAASTVSSADASRDDVDERSQFTSLLSINKGTPEEGREAKEEAPVVSVDRGKRGTRLSDNWVPLDEDCDYVRGLGVDPHKLRDEFVDFWIAVPGSRGLKLNWNATFRNRGREVAGRKNMRGKNGTVRQSLSELAFKLADEARDLERAAGVDSPDDGIRGHISGGPTNWIIS